MLPLRRTSSHLVWFVFYISVFFSPVAAEEKIYKWVDATGQVHYSNTPVKDAKPADLPEIKKENIEEKIENIKLNTPKNCQSRGGIDCSKGADKDGSVYCLDGYSEARLPFRFYCVEAQLEAETILSERDKDTKLITVTLRNNSPVEAKNIKVYYQYREADKVMGKKQKLEMSGEKSVPPYGLTSYTAFFQKNSRLINEDVLKKGKPVLKCDNCTTLRYKR